MVYNLNRLPKSEVLNPVLQFHCENECLCLYCTCSVLKKVYCVCVYTHTKNILADNIVVIKNNGA